MSLAAHRVVVLGGTFDPIHLGHLAVAAQAREALDADAVWLVPAASPPHRQTPRASSADRLAMVAAAAAADPTLQVVDVELVRGGPSYTVDTVVELAALHPAIEQWYLLGADAARDIRTWHNLHALQRLARFVVVNREGVGELTTPQALALGFAEDRLRVIRVGSPPISATEVRARARAGEPLDGLVPVTVARIIAARGLYAADPVG